MAQHSIQVGDWVLGVRAGDEEADRWVRAAFGDLLVDDPEIDPNYSIRLGEGAAGGKPGRGLSVLYRSHYQVVRGRSPERVWRGLVSWLAGHNLSAPPGQLVVEALTVVVDGRATLLPATLFANLDRIEPRLRRSGVRLVDGSAVLVDPATTTVIVPEPWPVAGDLGQRDPDEVAPGRYPLHAWGVEGPSGEVSVGHAMAAAMDMVSDRSDFDRAGLMGVLGSLLTTVGTGGIAWLENPEPQAARILALAGPA